MAIHGTKLNIHGVNEIESRISKGNLHKRLILATFIALDDAIIFSHFFNLSVDIIEKILYLSNR
jgi:hypothetical protein